MNDEEKFWDVQWPTCFCLMRALSLEQVNLLMSWVDSPGVKIQVSESIFLN